MSTKISNNTLYKHKSSDLRPTINVGTGRDPATRMSAEAVKNAMEKKVLQAGDEAVKSRLEMLRAKTSLHRAMCKKRSGDGVVKVQKLRTRHKFASPTDSLLSPCSQKLTQHKAKLFVAKSNPTKLNFATKHQQASDEDEDC